MANKYDGMNASIIEAVGGIDNVSKLFHCATRLRFALVDKSKADVEKVQKINGVMGCVSSADGVQVII